MNTMIFDSMMHEHKRRAALKYMYLSFLYI